MLESKPLPDLGTRADDAAELAAVLAAVAGDEEQLEWLQSMFSQEWFGHWRGVLRGNGFRGVVGDAEVGLVLFPADISFANHSCRPSARLEVHWNDDDERCDEGGGPPRLLGVLLAERSLSAGEEVTIDYLAGGDAGCDCAGRRLLLRDKLGFDCAQCAQGSAA